MRIVAGEFGGRVLTVPRHELRPTTERVREAVMSMLGPYVPGALVLDVFAGSGAYGFEALSRGAAKVVFVELDAGSCKTLEQNARTLKVEGRVTIHRGAAQRWLPKLTDRFDLLFCDPPYDLDEAAPLLEALAALATPTAHLLYEARAGATLPVRAGRFGRSALRSYGTAQVAVYADDEAASDGPPYT
ncbi:MAG: 16S rRNA (guanine(966)-N(2))-methyltransferase RsmD [Myxococcales bacterium]|nr:16S rRNA (guanine(966)-N(2))-methyltransferase RsmD [Myxococcales bacterium]